MRPVVLHVEDLTIHFGGIHALEGSSFYVKEGQITGLIGPNGAGKTTVFNLLTGVYTPDREIFILRIRASCVKKPISGAGWVSQEPFRTFDFSRISPSRTTSRRP
jgi:ABC-type branched-subunit amino acid transport system ATPase component